jgi:hypothetical protein
MKFFGSSLAIRDNFKVAFFGKKLTTIISTENSATFISGNQYDRWSQQTFLLLSHLATAVERNISILLRGKPKEQVQSATKISQGVFSSTLVSAKFTERQTHNPQLKFFTQPVPKTVVQFHRIDNS